MCSDEVFGDWYSECHHFDPKYETGTRFDCQQQNCALSSKHSHTAAVCPCQDQPYQERRIQNIFRKICPECEAKRSQEFDRRVGRKPNKDAQFY